MVTSELLPLLLFSLFCMTDVMTWGVVHGLRVSARFVESATPSDIAAEWLMNVISSGSPTRRDAPVLVTR